MRFAFGSPSYHAIKLFYSSSLAFVLFYLLHLCKLFIAQLQLQAANVLL